MQKYFLLPSLMFVMMLAGHAQVNLNLAFNSRPQPYLADWSNNVNGRAIITIGNTPADPSIKFKTTITNQNGSVIGTTDLHTATIYTLNRLPATNFFTLGDVVQLQSMQFNTTAQNLLQSSGRMTAGAYIFTVQVYNTRDSLMAERITTLNITAYQLPTLIMPGNNTELDAHVASAIITFRWTRLSPVSQEQPRYRVQVFEVLNEQTPMQAFRSNQPLLDQEAVKGATQLIWRTNLPMLDTLANRQFIWTVQTLDFNGNPVPTNDMNLQGRSEPAVFKIINQAASTNRNGKQTAPVKKDEELKKQ